MISELSADRVSQKYACKLSGESTFRASTLRCVKGNVYCPINTDLWSRVCSPACQKQAILKLPKVQNIDLLSSTWISTDKHVGWWLTVVINRMCVRITKVWHPAGQPVFTHRSEYPDKPTKDPWQTTFDIHFLFDTRVLFAHSLTRRASCVERC